jgi:hypothetical protein
MTYQSEGERARRTEYVRDSAAAAKSGTTIEARTQAREASADEWAAWLHRQMEKTGAASPSEVLPDALAKLEQRLNDHVAAFEQFKGRLSRALKG